jgi:aminopeptidase N
MFVMDGYTDSDSPGDVFRVNDHEHGHEWFPMLVGSNERRYGWMDEGINTYINSFSQERRYGAELKSWPPGLDSWVSFLGAWVQTLMAGIDAPIMTAPDHMSADAMGNDAYEKPAAVLLALRDHVIGREAMDRALREYVRRWSYKHPTPGDFFRTVENVSGQDLSWFWRGFFYSTDVLDIGIDSVVTHTPSARDSASGTTASIYLHRHTSLVFPIELRLKLADGSTPDARFPVDIWAQGVAVEVRVPVAAKVVGARLWPDRTAIPDLRPDNDLWGDPPPAIPAGAATTGGLASNIAPR